MEEDGFKLVKSKKSKKSGFKIHEKKVEVEKELDSNEIDDIVR